MKRIKPHVNTYCTYCKALGTDRVKAVWRISYDTTQRACEAHRGLLHEYESKMRQQENYSEADYATWMRL